MQTPGSHPIINLLLSTSIVYSRFVVKLMLAYIQCDKESLLLSESVLKQIIWRYKRNKEKETKKGNKKCGGKVADFGILIYNICWNLEGCFGILDRNVAPFCTYYTW